MDRHGFLPVDRLQNRTFGRCDAAMAYVVPNACALTVTRRWLFAGTWRTAQRPSSTNFS
jgi:hypothetical protein